MWRKSKLLNMAAPDLPSLRRRMGAVMQALGMNLTGLDTWTGAINDYTDSGQWLEDQYIQNWRHTCMAQSVQPSGKPILEVSRSSSEPEFKIRDPYTANYLEACMVARSGVLPIAWPLLSVLADGGDVFTQRPQHNPLLFKLPGRLKYVVGVMNTSNAEHNVDATLWGHWITVVYIFESNTILLLNSLPSYTLSDAKRDNLIRTAPLLHGHLAHSAVIMGSYKWKVVQASTITRQGAAECGVRACIFAWAVSMWPEQFLPAYLGRSPDPMAGYARDTTTLTNVMSLVSQQCLMSLPQTQPQSQQQIPPRQPQMSAAAAFQARQAEKRAEAEAAAQKMAAQAKAEAEAAAQRTAAQEKQALAQWYKDKRDRTLMPQNVTNVQGMFDSKPHTCACTNPDGSNKITLANTLSPFSRCNTCGSGYTETTQPAPAPPATPFVFKAAAVPKPAVPATPVTPWKVAKPAKKVTPAKVVKPAKKVTPAKVAKPAMGTPAKVMKVAKGSKYPGTTDTRKCTAAELMQETKLIVRAAHQVFGRYVPENIPIEWSSQLSSTAGKAFYSPSKQANSVRLPSGRYSKVRLSAGLLNTRAKLWSTLLHELCHVAVYAQYKDTKQAHGPEFHEWGQRVTNTFGVPVTRCHDYGKDPSKVAYLWLCKCKNPDGTPLEHTKTAAMRTPVNVTRICRKCRSQLRNIPRKDWKRLGLNKGK